MRMLIDTHAHLDFEDYQNDIDTVIDNAHNADVRFLINVGIDLKTSQASIALAEKYPNVYAAVGIHPHDSSSETIEADMVQIEALLAHEKVVALGEIGLDYFKNYAPHDVQRRVFKSLLQCARTHTKPIIIHARDSHDDVYAILEEVYGNEPIKGVMHCFSGSEADLQKALSLGLFISFTGPITYKKNDELRRLMTLVPDDCLLLETDSPFLAPQSHRGKRNEPALLAEVAAYSADLRHITRDDLGRITTNNCNTLFGFPTVERTPQIVYKIRHSLYINTTNSCTNDCYFCARFSDDYVKGHNLRITKDPRVEDVLAEIKTYDDEVREIVFCGFGEPLLRIDFITAVARELKKEGRTIRIDTNGHGNIIHKRNVLPELEGLVDEMCISLNAPDEALYNTICKPHFSGNVFGDVIEFIREAKKVIPRVVITFLDLPEVDAKKMETIVHELGVAYRLRHYNKVG